MSSNQALQCVRRLYRAQKAGHTGSLDPLASGVLPLCFGDATKFSQYLLDSDKVYAVTACMGIATDTGDAQGQVTSEQAMPACSTVHIESILSTFRGTQQQIPPMYSALKHQGQPLYKLARQGQVIERASRQITVHQLTLVRWDAPYLSLEVAVSKGTYVRTLVEDVGQALGVGAHVVTLRRLQAGPFSLPETVSLSSLMAIEAAEGVMGLQRLLQPVGRAVADWPSVVLSPESAEKLLQGQAVAPLHALRAERVQIHQWPNRFLGVGEILPDGRVAPRRLVCAISE